MPILFLTITLSFYYSEKIQKDVDLFRTFQALTSFFLWLKVFYFFRLFDSTGYYIGILINVLNDMKAFLLVLLCGIIMFADSMLKLSLGNQEEDERYLNGFIDAIVRTYGLILGGFSIDEYQGKQTYSFIIVLFVLCLLFNMIILLNLLIAIISNSFEIVNANSELQQYKEKAALIAENFYLIPKKVIEETKKPELYLFVIKNLDNMNLKKKERNISKRELMEQITSTIRNNQQMLKDDMIQSFKEQLTEEMKKKIQGGMNEMKKSVEDLNKKFEEIQKSQNPNEVKEVKQDNDNEKKLSQEKIRAKMQLFDDLSL